MKSIKVLGTGCANCRATLKLIETAAEEQGIEIRPGKAGQIQDIIAYGIMSTAGAVVEGWRMRAVCRVATISPDGYSMIWE